MNAEAGVSNRGSSETSFVNCILNASLSLSEVVFVEANTVFVEIDCGMK